MKAYYNNYINQNPKFNLKTKISILCLIIAIAGIFGFIYEFIFYYFNSGMQKLFWRGGNFLPWINIYAYGAIGIYFLTYRYRKKPLKVFLLSLIICGLLEYIAGFGMYKLGNGFRCWDYNQEILNFGNINGFICLRSVLFFGLSGLLLIYLIVPMCYCLAQKINSNIFFIICITLFTIIFIDEIYNLLIARLLNLPRASDIYKNLGFNYVNFKSLLKIKIIV